MNDIILHALVRDTHGRYQHEGAQARLIAQARTISRSGTAMTARYRLSRVLVLVDTRLQQTDP